MKVDRDDRGQIFYEYSLNSNSFSSKNGKVKMKREDVLHILGHGFDGLVGYSPIAMAKNAIGLAIATEDK